MLDMGGLQDLTGKAQFWGVARFETNFDILEQYGIFLEGRAGLLVNLTGTTKTETLVLEGIPGDKLFTVEGNAPDFAALTADLPAGGPLTAADLSADWAGRFTASGITLAAGTTPTVEVVVTSSKWRVVDQGQTYFIELVRGSDDNSSADDRLEVRGEEQTVDLTPNTVTVEVLGSLRVKDPTAKRSQAPYYHENDPDWLALNGAFYLNIRPGRFEIFVLANASLKAQADGASDLLSGKATGLFVAISEPDANDPDATPGVAAMFSLDVQAGGVNDESGIGGSGLSEITGVFKISGKVQVMLNTTRQELTFRVPDSFLPLLPPGDPTEITIFQSLPNLRGDAPLDAAASEVYVSARIMGAIRLYDTLTLSGYLGFQASGSIVRIMGAVSTEIENLGALSGSIDFTFFTPQHANGAGIVGRARLALVDEGVIAGISLSGQFLLEVNSFAGATTVDTFMTQYEAGQITDPLHPDANLLATDSDGNVILGPVTLGADFNLRLVLEGHLKSAGVVDMSGRFEFAFHNNPFRLEVMAVGALILDTIGSLEFSGAMRIDETGLVAGITIHLHTDSAFGEAIGLSFENATGQLELNTTPGTWKNIAPGFRLHIDGTINFDDFATASGSVTIDLRQGKFVLETDLTLRLAAFEVAVKGGGAIYIDSRPGVALNLSVSLKADIFKVVTINGTGRLQVNTSGTSRYLSGTTLGAESFGLVLNGKVSILRVLSFNAGFTVQVGGEKDVTVGYGQTRRSHFLDAGEWVFAFNAGAGIFGLNTSVSGWINSRGHFDVAFSLRLNATVAGTGIDGTGHFRMGLDQNSRNEFRLNVSAGGKVAVKVLGVSIGSFGVSVNIKGEGPRSLPIQFAVTYSYYD